MEVKVARDPRIPTRLDLYIGEWYDKTVRQVAAVAKHQWVNDVEDGIRGYIFYGKPGTGKTWTAFRVAEVLGLLNLYHKEGIEVVVFQDCADLASWRYGETEKQIREVFRKAYSNAQQIKRLNKDLGVLLIFDDAEALFLTRSYGSKLDTWYIAQLNVFFHEVDAMRTSELFVILTTNRLDLLDEALRDRFVEVKFPYPPKVTLLELAEKRLRRYGINDEELIGKVKQEVYKKAQTFRDVNRITTQAYVKWVSMKYGV